MTCRVHKFVPQSYEHADGCLGTLCPVCGCCGHCEDEGVCRCTDKRCDCYDASAVKPNGFYEEIRVSRKGYQYKVRVTLYATNQRSSDAPVRKVRARGWGNSVMEALLDARREAIEMWEDMGKAPIDPYEHIGRKNG